VKAIRLTLMASAVATVLSVGLTSAHAAQSVPASAAENSNKYFVELTGLPTTDGGKLDATRAEKVALRKAIAKAGIKLKERRAFDVLFNGLSVEVSAKDRAKLARLPGVKAVYPMLTVAAPKPISAEVISRAVKEARAAATLSTLPPTNASALAMTGADIAQSQYGLTGAGIKVGIIDTGIDIDHPDLGGNGTNGSTAFPSARVAYGYDFVGDAYNADPASPSYNPIPTPDANPDDCGGHGTHVAGIVGANGVVKGVAPDVTFGAYRVFGCAGSTDSDIIIAAMERALADGMQVVNQSLGAAFQWPEYPSAKAADRLVKAGVTMVASIGNSGASGIWSAGAPGVGEKVIGVASYDNTTIDLRDFTLSTGGAPIGYLEATGAPASPTSGTYPLSRTGTPASLDDGCTAPAAGSLTGTVTLIRRGTCSFYQKAINAQNAGAAGVILYNNVPGFINPTVAGTPAVTIPVVSITATDGAAIDAQIAAGPVSLNWTADFNNFANPTGGLISSFSSYGLAPDLTLKPNLGAPGGSILSTYPLELGGYGVLSGTSMSSPNVAGTVALLLQGKPGLKPADIKAVLQNGADPKTWSASLGSTFIDPVHRQGAGLIDIVQVIKTKTVVSPSELSLGESQAGPATKTVTVKNLGNKPVTYTLGTGPALATGPSTFVPSFYNSVATVAFSTPTLTVPAKGSASFDATITAPTTMPDNGLYGGYITLTDTAEGGQVQRVPYAGFKGNYQSVAVMTPTANGFPWLSQLVGGFYNNRPTGGTFTMAGDDIPFFLIHMDHFGRKMVLTAYDQLTGAAVGTISTDSYLPRSSTSTGFYAFTWDGTVQSNGFTVTVPNGNYTVKIKMLKALGDPQVAADSELWTSPTVTVARP